MDKLRQAQVNPIVAIVGAVALVLVLGYFFWLRPAQQEDAIRNNWNTPEAAALRAPGGRPKNEEHERFVEQLRQKEGASESRPTSRRDR